MNTAKSTITVCDYEKAAAQGTDCGYSGCCVYQKVGAYGDSCGRKAGDPLPVFTSFCKYCGVEYDYSACPCCGEG